MECPNCQTKNPEGAQYCGGCDHTLAEPTHTPTSAPAAPPLPEPTSFVGGRYEVKRSLGEGGMKRVYLAYDTKLDQDVAFSLIKTERPEP